MLLLHVIRRRLTLDLQRTHIIVVGRPVLFRPQLPQDKYPVHSCVTLILLSLIVVSLQVFALAWKFRSAFCLRKAEFSFDESITVHCTCDQHVDTVPPVLQSASGVHPLWVHFITLCSAFYDGVWSCLYCLCPVNMFILFNVIWSITAGGFASHIVFCSSVLYFLVVLTVLVVDCDIACLWICEPCNSSVCVAISMFNLCALFVCFDWILPMNVVCVCDYESCVPMVFLSFLSIASCEMMTCAEQFFKILVVSSCPVLWMLENDCEIYKWWVCVFLLMNIRLVWFHEVLSLLDLLDIEIMCLNSLIGCSSRFCSYYLHCFSNSLLIVQELLFSHSWTCEWSMLCAFICFDWLVARVTVLE